MANSTLDQATLSLLNKSFSNLSIDSASAPSKISSTIFPESNYTDAEKAEIDQWVISASHTGTAGEDVAKSAERFATLNRHLCSRTTILGSKPSVADIAVYQHLAPIVSKWSAEERTGEQGYHHIVRHVDFVQNSSVFDLKIADGEKVKIDTDEVKFALKPVDVKAEKERKKKEAAVAAAAAAAGTTTTANETSTKDKVKGKLEAVADSVAAVVPGVAPSTSSGAKEGFPTKKKEKKEKAGKPAKPVPVEKPLSPALIDLRVGHILKCINHPDAEKLYVSTMAVGDAPGSENTSEYEGQVVRTVCSGLNGLIPLSEMQGRKVVAVCNLKPVTMRGIKSCAMVLAASPRSESEDGGHAGPVELVMPPAEAPAGERVYFEGWEGEPEGVLNPKKKVWETVQPGFTTTGECEAAFEVEAVSVLKEQGRSGVGKLRTKEGICVVKSLKGATIR